MKCFTFIASAGMILAQSSLLELDEALRECGGVGIRELTIQGAHNLFLDGALTSEELTLCYTRRIQEMNPMLNAVLEVNPDAIEIARTLDQQMSRGQLVGPLHGIPILVKDNIATGDKMNTTAGSWALLGTKPRSDADVIRLLRRAGAIILGKTNLSELAGIRGFEAMRGWSGRGGQTKNPYLLKESPQGSSSGSAVAIAANLALVALGTETEGSIINPSTVASLVGFKPSVGKASGVGLIPLAPSHDSVGVLSRTLEDNIKVASIITQQDLNQQCLNLQGLKVGLVQHSFEYATPAQISEFGFQIWALNPMLANMRSQGIQIKNVTLDISELNYEKVVGVFSTEFKHYLNQYLQELTLPNQPIQSLQDIINFNTNHPNLSPGIDQELLIMAQKSAGIHDPTYLQNLQDTQPATQRMVDDLMLKNDLQALISLSDPFLASQVPSALSGYPIITIPAGVSLKGVPFGVSIYSKWGHESTILTLAKVMDPHTSSRNLPKFIDSL